MSRINRRRFLELASASTLLPLADLTHAKNTPNRKLGVALLGLGYYSRELLAPGLQLTKHCELRGIITGSPDKIPVWKNQYGIKDRHVYHYDNLHEIADNPDIDVVYVVTPTGLHKKYTIIAANAGKHVWCEKPMAMTAADCQAMIDTCNSNKVQLAIGYRMQHEPNTQTVMAMAEQKPYGDIVKLEAFAGYQGGRPAPSNWRLNAQLGGGAAYDMGVYPLNGVRNAIGQEPIAVRDAQFKVWRPETFKEVDEEARYTLEFPGGVIAKCGASVFQNMNSLHVDCTRGWYELVPFQSYTGVKGITSSGHLLNKTIEHQQAQQMDNDALAIINQTAPKVPGQEGLNDIRVIEAIFQSAHNNGSRVEI